MTDAELSALFSAVSGAQENVAEADADLMARVLRDAIEMQPGARAAMRRSSPLEELFRALGGWMGVGGLAAASITGVLLGFNVSGEVPGVTTFLTLDTAIVDPFTGFDVLLEEG
ncbi:hypothetical protein [Primorskyibacter sp. S187A]|uniref:hypothetical protein n=1 Tax=Primorskyibacter sp. S187A TaxID=3415130 RepID=UPI003C7A5251